MVGFARLDLMPVSYIRPVFWFMERFKLFDYGAARSKSGSSIIDLFAAKVGVETARVTNAMRNISSFFISRWVLWFRD